MATLAKAVAVSPVAVVASTNSVVQGAVVRTAAALTAAWSGATETGVVA